MNSIIIKGRLTKDPELRYTQSDTAVCTVNVAVDRPYSKDKETDFFTVVFWRQTAEFVSKYFHKGDAIGIEGTIQTRNYEDRQGNKRTAVEVVADNVFFVGGKSSGSAGPAMQAVPATPAPAAPVAYSSGAASDFEEVETDNDLPF